MNDYPLKIQVHPRGTWVDLTPDYQPERFGPYFAVHLMSGDDGPIPRRWVVTHLPSGHAYCAMRVGAQQGSAA